MSISTENPLVNIQIQAKPFNKSVEMIISDVWGNILPEVLKEYSRSRCRIAVISNFSTNALHLTLMNLKEVLKYSESFLTLTHH